MSYPVLEKLSNKSTFKELVSFLKGKYQRKQMTNFYMNLRSFRMTQSFLIMIYDRIIKDVKTDNRYWSIRAEFEYLGNEEYEPSKEEKLLLKEFPKIQNCLYLDVEDWFLHAHILMEKFCRLSKSLMILTAHSKKIAKKANELPERSFNKHIKHFLKEGNKGLKDVEYARLLDECRLWYATEIKDTRDDLIQHEIVGRFWGSSIGPNRFVISRFLHPMKMAKKIYEIREKYSSIYPRIKKEQNIFVLLKFFENEINSLEPEDRDRFINIKKKRGKEFPNIPKLYSKMNLFFSKINDYFLMKAKEHTKTS